MAGILRGKVVTLLGCISALGCASRPPGNADSIGKTGLVALGDMDAGLRVFAEAAVAEDAGLDNGSSRPLHVLDDAERAQVLAPYSAGSPGASGLVLHVAERGPGEPWAIAVRNEGTEKAHFVADTRLIWLEVTQPNSKKAARCRLPDDLQPKAAEPRLDVELEPGEYVAQLIDPRLYCFASGAQKELIPGAQVVPHMGWPNVADKSEWEHGKKVKKRVPQPPPFVAYKATIDVDEVMQARSNALKVAKAARNKRGKRVESPTDESLGVPLPPGIDKHLAGPELKLQSAYSEWSSLHPKASDTDDGPLELTVVQGSDAHTEHDATVEIALHNRSKKRLQLYFRREFVTFEVVGPNGVVTCAPSPDERVPDRSAFMTLPAGAKRTYKSRLVELCPMNSFEMPGLYLVNARYDATHSGSDWNIDAYTGAIASSRPGNIRIRTGELSILHKVYLSRPTDPAPTAAAATGDAGPASPTSP